ncbi:MAG: hypothetical protein JWP34_1066 [Massilia sp.]|jgi:opacity protein-like surface antigen|nr:hypothetical protein [Massilia sp.]
MLKKIVAAAALAMVASSSFAAAGQIYGGLDVGSSKLDDFSGRQTSFGGFVGYTFTENFSIEGGYRNLGKWDVPAFGGDFKVDQTHVSVVGSYPLSRGFNVFGRLGYSHFKEKYNEPGFSDSTTESKALYGIGLGYDFTGNIAARVEFQKPASRLSNFGASIIYKF